MTRAIFPGRGLSFLNGQPDGPTDQFLRDQFDQLAGIDLTGEIRMYGGPTAPTGWLICNGSAVSRHDQARLFAVLSTTYGAGDGSTTFNLPDLRGVFPMGASGSRALGTTGGAATHTLTEDELPEITPAITDPGHTHTVTDPGHHHSALVAASTATIGTDAGSAAAGNTGDAVTGVTVDSAGTGITIAPFGGGQAFPTVPPYLAVNFIIRAG